MLYYTILYYTILAIHGKVFRTRRRRGHLRPRGRGAGAARADGGDEEAQVAHRHRGGLPLYTILYYIRADLIVQC